MNFRQFFLNFKNYFHLNNEFLQIIRTVFFLNIKVCETCKRYEMLDLRPTNMNYIFLRKNNSYNLENLGFYRF